MGIGGINKFSIYKHDYYYLVLIIASRVPKIITDNLTSLQTWSEVWNTKIVFVVAPFSPLPTPDTMLHITKPQCLYIVFFFWGGGGAGNEMIAFPFERICKCVIFC